MYDEPVQLGIKAQDTSNARSPQTTTIEQSLLYEKTTPPIALKLSNSTLILVPFGLVLLWTIALFYVRQQAKRQNNALSRGDGRKPLNRLPCRNCIFFKNNPYLKCAINPIDALTTKAIDCTDYTPDSLSRHQR
ncbi:MAG: hypothetical protein KME42_26365 [Tildeniella nuda ZEHNDER 1965/U140]|jgi:hypothetical protein|nr:hypothetical protein [Tildeniella nuda ZEHNDER 1965/U140]